MKPIKLIIKTNSEKYPIFIGKNLITKISSLMINNSIKSKKCLLVVDRKVPKKFIHKPWEMEFKYQEAIKTIIGKDYPKPIVIHEKARAAALEAFQSLKK